MARVTAGKVYTYQPVGMDVWNSRCKAVPGTKVRVVNLPGCPKANTMGHAHVQDPDTGAFLGLVLTNSLTR